MARKNSPKLGGLTDDVELFDIDPLTVEMDLDSTPIEPSDSEGDLAQTSTPLTPIGLGKPLSIRIRSMFSGGNVWHRRTGRAAVGDVLVTSAVKNPLFYDAAPLAMNYYFPKAQSEQRLKPLPTAAGSDVVFYSPGVVSDSLQVQVQMSFDRFDEQRYLRWTKAVGAVAGLPVFAVPGPQGVGLRALIVAAENTAEIILRSIDRWVDGSNDWISTGAIHVAEAGEKRARSGYVLFYGNDQDHKPIVPGHGGVIFEKEFRKRKEQYVVRDGTLRYREAPDQLVLQGEPYVLAILNGAREPHLKQWAPAAVTAILADRFLNMEENGSSDFVGILSAYNDIVMARKISELDDELADDTLDADTRSKLSAQRSGAFKNLQDDDIKELMKAAR